jgi:hypothetical protein
VAANSLSNQVKQSRNEVLVNAGNDRDGKPFEFLDAAFQVKVSGKDTEGRCFKFQVGEKILRLEAADSLIVPREMPHAFVKTSESTIGSVPPESQKNCRRVRHALRRAISQPRLSEVGEYGQNSKHQCGSR